MGLYDKTEKAGAHKKGLFATYFTAWLVLALAIFSATPPALSAGAPDNPGRGVKIALVLPLSGPFASIGERVLDGAGLAQSFLAKDGLNAQVRAVDTGEPGWLEELAGLPGDVAVIGGPIRPDMFRLLYAAGQQRKRAVFAFTSSLDKAREGVEAWRFFAAPEDQARALIRTAMDEFGVRNFGVLHPDEDYGRRMAELFTNQAKTMGAAIAARKSYPPDNPLEWRARVKDLLDQAARAGLPLGAVFLPDGWPQAEMLAPSFYYFGQEHLLLMGSNLWGETLSQGMNVSERIFRLSFFPSAWTPANKSFAARELGSALSRTRGRAEPGLWEALGFDFVRFAVRLGPLSPGWTPELVNERVVSAQNMDWSMAPLFWNDQRQVSQNLFLLTPAKGGKVPADIPGIKERRRQSMLRKRVGGE